MGQQQLLLLVLGVVIVGLAVVVGIQAFSENQKSANADALVNDGIRLASDIQAWANKPPQFGGMADDETLADVSFDDIGLEGSPYENLNGQFTIEESECAPAPDIPSDESAVVWLRGVGDVNNDGTFTTANDGVDNVVCVGIAGTDPDDIGTGVSVGSGDATGGGT